MLRFLQCRTSVFWPYVSLLILVYSINNYIEVTHRAKMHHSHPPKTLTFSNENAADELHCKLGGGFSSRLSSRPRSLKTGTFHGWFGRFFSSAKRSRPDSRNGPCFTGVSVVSVAVQLAVGLIHETIFLHFVSRLGIPRCHSMVSSEQVVCPVVCHPPLLYPVHR
jgi:hypothetical protein